MDKRYVTDIDLKSTTTTGDPEGAILESHVPPAREQLEASLERLRGEVELPIPAASAVKIDGERAYKLSRRGVVVEMPLRRTQVHALDVIAYTGDTVKLSLHVGSGTYVRAVAIALGGHCTSLRRTAVGPFSVDEATDGARVDTDGVRLLPVAQVLENLDDDAVARVPRNVVQGVLTLAAGDGREAT